MQIEMSNDQEHDNRSDFISRILFFLPQTIDLGLRVECVRDVSVKLP